jgi:hypothetical protein
VLPSSTCRTPSSALLILTSTPHLTSTSSHHLNPKFLPHTSGPISPAQLSIPKANRMPFAWTPESERTLLLVAVSQGSVQPGATLWNAMIQALGDGVTDRSVRYSTPAFSQVFRTPFTSPHSHPALTSCCTTISPSHQPPILKPYYILLCCSPFCTMSSTWNGWNSDSERNILLLAMGKTVSFHKSGSFCAEVATFLGGGVTPNAVR